MRGGKRGGKRELTFTGGASQRGKENKQINSAQEFVSLNSCIYQILL